MYVSLQAIKCARDVTTWPSVMTRLNAAVCHGCNHVSSCNNQCIFPSLYMADSRFGSDGKSEFSLIILRFFLAEACLNAQEAVANNGSHGCKFPLPSPKEELPHTTVATTAQMYHVYSNDTALNL